MSSFPFTYTDTCQPKWQAKNAFFISNFFVRRRLTIPLSCTSYFGPEWVDWGMNIISQKKSWKIPQNTNLNWNNHKYLNLFWVHGIWITWRMKIHSNWKNVYMTHKKEYLIVVVLLTICFWRKNYTWSLYSYVYAYKYINTLLLTCV